MLPTAGDAGMEKVTECAETVVPEKEKLCVLGSQVSNHHYEVGWRIRVTINPNPSASERLQVSFSLRANTPSQASLKDDHIVTGSSLKGLLGIQWKTNSEKKRKHLLDR